MKENKITRRNFLEKSTIATGIAPTGTLGIPNTSSAFTGVLERLPREVWVATVSQMDLTASSSKEMVNRVLTILEDVAAYQPDIVCLPEVFATSNVDQKYSMNEKIKWSSEALQQIAKFSEKNNCNTVCSVYTSENGKAYNSAVILDRLGKRIGEYRKIHPTKGEMEKGVSSGPADPPVFKMDFGIIGAQICFDILYDDGWKKLSEQGAELVFWPSAFAGGKMVNSMCWRNLYPVVSSTRKNTSKICDISGNQLAATGYWNKNWTCAPVNLETAILRIWPSVKSFNEIGKKYGRKVQISISQEEGWAVIESRSPEIFVKDILKEFNLKTWNEVILESDEFEEQ